MRQSGIILITMLFFLLAMSLGLLMVFEQGLLSNRMSINYYERGVAWEEAETGLRLGEAFIRAHPLSPDQIDEAPYRIQLISTDACGKKRYRISATGTYQHSRVQLISEYEQLRFAQKPECQKEIIDRRVFWKRGQ